MLVKTCAEIVNELVYAVENKKDVNLNGLKHRIARKNKLTCLPKLVDIISAIPDQHRTALLPKLKAKPIRTASGVSSSNMLDRYLGITHYFFRLL